MFKTFISFKYSLYILLLITGNTIGSDQFSIPLPNSKGNIGVTIVPSLSTEIYKKWYNKPPVQGEQVSVIKTVKQDETVFAGFLISGMMPDSQGNYSYNVSFYVLAPDGEPFTGQRNYLRGAGVVPRKSSYVLAKPVVDFVMNESSPEGVYTILAQVFDYANGQKSNASYQIAFSK